ncbi:MAG: hypothetical protein J1F65_04315 [Clostridiales bacterium]|nr:hypothetical protein [Clostridiales bacterium]
MKKFAKIMAVVLVAVMALALLVSCGPASDPDKALAALKDNGYVLAAKNTGLLSLTAVEVIVGAERGDVVAIVTGTKTDDDNKLQTITIWYFKDSAAANKAWDKAQQHANSEKDDDASDWVVAKSGAMIYYGTSQAVKDAR